MEPDPPPIRVTAEEAWRAQPPPATPVRPVIPPAPPAAPRTSMTAVFAFALGLIGLPLAGCALGPVAIVCAAFALAEIHRSAELRGERWAYLGLAFGILGFVGWTIGLYVVLGRGGLFGPSRQAALPVFTSDTAASLDGASEELRPALQANVLVQGRGAGQTVHWTGSGVLIGREGERAFVLTNRHVAAPDGEPGDRLSARFSRGGTVPARVAWLAPDGVDVAVLEVDAAAAEGLPAIPLEPAADVRVGDPVYAVGNPLELVGTCTTGIASALRRTRVGGHELRILQVQAPLNQGNSGGGLYARGRLVGVNTWAGDKSQSEGVGFAISSVSIVELLREAAPSWLPSVIRAEEPERSK